MDCPYSKQPCDDKKVLHITEIKKDGSYHEVHMCHKCAAKYDCESIEPEPKAKPEAPSVGGLLGLLTLLMLGKTVAQKKAIEKSSKTTKCPGCGITPEEISKTGKLGCAKCYDYYHASIEHILQKCQHSTNHVGKSPKNFEEQKEKRRLEKEAALDVKAQIKNLEEKMDKAIKVENYEVAGVLKLKIQKLREQLES